MGLKLNTASSGSVTLEPANTASNYTLTVPAQTGTVVATDSSGNVGIGGTPVSLASTKILTVTDSTEARIQLQNTASGSTSADGVSLAINGTDFYVNNRENGNIITYVNGSERMRIDSSGRVLVGASSAASSMGTRVGGLQSGNGFIMGSEAILGGSNRVITFNADFNYFIELTVTVWGNGGTSIYQGKFIAGRRDWTGSPHANNYADQIGSALDVSVSSTDNSPSTNFRSYTLTFTNNTDGSNNHWMVEYKLRNINSFNIA